VDHRGNRSYSVAGAHRGERESHRHRVRADPEDRAEYVEEEQSAVERDHPGSPTVRHAPVKSYD